jgi:hypothetical protein
MCKRLQRQMSKCASGGLVDCPDRFVSHRMSLVHWGQATSNTAVRLTGSKLVANLKRSVFVIVRILAVYTRGGGRRFIAATLSVRVGSGLQCGQHDLGDGPLLFCWSCSSSVGTCLNGQKMRSRLDNIWLVFSVFQKITQCACLIVSSFVLVVDGVG